MAVLRGAGSERTRRRHRLVRRRSLGVMRMRTTGRRRAGSCQPSKRFAGRSPGLRGCPAIKAGLRRRSRRGGERLLAEPGRPRKEPGARRTKRRYADAAGRVGQLERRYRRDPTRLKGDQGSRTGLNDRASSTTPAPMPFGTSEALRTARSGSNLTTTKGRAISERGRCTGWAFRRNEHKNDRVDAGRW